MTANDADTGGSTRANVNAKVTNAIIATKLDGLTYEMREVVQEMKTRGDRHSKRLRAEELARATLEAEMLGLKEDMRVLKMRSNLWDSLNSVGALIAGIWGGLK